MISSRQRLQWLDAARGISCLAVVIYHYIYRYDELYGHDFSVPEFFSLGAMGVAAFFMVSGFVISMSLEKANLLEFLINRVSRLYPAYWVALIFTFSWVGFFGLPGRQVSFADFLINFTMLQEFLRVPHVDGAYWTLTVELIFYFWIIIIWRLRFLQRPLLLLMTISIVSTLMVLTGAKGFAFKSIERIFMLDYGILFFSGVVFLGLWRKGIRVLHALPVLGLALLSLYLRSYDLYKFLAVCGVYCLFFVFCVFHIENVKFPRVLLYLGSITYSLYLVHQNVGYSLILMLSPHFGGHISVILALLASLLFASLLHYFVENPSLNLLRKYGSRVVKPCN